MKVTGFVMLSALCFFPVGSALADESLNADALNGQLLYVSGGLDTCIEHCYSFTAAGNKIRFAAMGAEGELLKTDLIDINPANIVSILPGITGIHSQPGEILQQSALSGTLCLTDKSRSIELGDKSILHIGIVIIGYCQGPAFTVQVYQNAIPASGPKQ